MNFKNHFRGALLGTMVGDVLGMPVEGMERKFIRHYHGTVKDILPQSTYTDDTEMMIGLAEALLDDFIKLDYYFAKNFTENRGYGDNTRSILSAIKNGVHWSEAVKKHGYPGGSFGNGSAMRVAPISLAYFNDVNKIIEKSKQQSLVTGHSHPIGKYGAVLQALAVHTAIICGVKEIPFECLGFIKLPDEFNIVWIQNNINCSEEEAINKLGTGLKSSESVSIALWSFLSTDNFEEAVIKAVNLGGDTDTIGAMTGSIACAYYGLNSFPERWVISLDKKVRDYIIELADKLLEVKDDFN